MNWEEYEDVTKDIYEALGRQNGVKIIGHGRNSKIKGKSGVEHQIDVLTEHTDGMHQYLTDIECKYWADKVNKDTVMKVKSIVDDCDFAKGIIVSKMGFTEDATTYAKYVNVGLVILREPIDKDWEGRVQNIELRMHLHVPEIMQVNQAVTKMYMPSSKIAVTVDDHYYLYPDSSRKTVREIVEDFQALLTQDTAGEEVVHEQSFPDGTVLIGPDGQEIAEVSALQIKGVLRVSTETVNIKGADSVWFIMKSIFEEKRFTVSSEGEIRDVSE